MEKTLETGSRLKFLILLFLGIWIFFGFLTDTKIKLQRNYTVRRPGEIFFQC